MSIGQNIAAKRKELKLSQEYIANQLGVSRQAVSKWETGQTEPTAKNLVELAHLFDMTVSELVEPEKMPCTETTVPKKNWKLGLQRFAIVAYSASAMMYMVETNDPVFPVFVTFLILITAIWMAVNILLLPSHIRTKMAVRELCYCILIYCIVTFVEPIIRNVYASILILICCIAYVGHIRFKEDP